MIKDIEYTNRISTCSLFAYRVDKHALSAGIQKIMAKEMTDGVKAMAIEMFSDNKMFLSPPTIEQKKEWLSKIDQGLHFKNLNEVAGYTSWVFNYSLILMCGIFENYLTEVVSEIIGSGDVLVHRVILSDFIEKFKYKSIESKVKIYNRVLDIPLCDFFDFRGFTLEIRKRYKGFGKKDLVKIFEKRHKAAHSEKPVIFKEELFEISDILQKIILNLSSKVFKKYGISTQFREMVKGNNPYIDTAG